MIQDWWNLYELQAAYRNGLTDPVEVAEAALIKAAQSGPDLHAFNDITANFARESALRARRVLREGSPVSALHGVPIVVKDVLDIEGYPTTGGCIPPWKKRAVSTSPSVRRLIQSGAVLIGKTQTSQFAFGGWGTNSVSGTPLNPWDRKQKRVAGGSSAGSAAALAADLAICALGTDTGGSVRIPAAFCGVCGLKVTEDRLSSQGMMPLSPTLDTIGPMARSIDDLMVMWLVLTGQDTPGFWEHHQQFAGHQNGVAGLAFAIPDEDSLALCSREVRGCFLSSLNILEKQGARLVPFRPPVPFSAMAEDNGQLIAAEAWREHGAVVEDAKTIIDVDVGRRVRAGSDIDDEAYFGLLGKMHQARRSFLASFTDYDALLLPTTTDTAPIVEEIDQSDSPTQFTRPVNYLGLCAISLPMGLAEGHLPCGLQIVVRGNDEMKALYIASNIEACIPPIDRSVCKIKTSE